MMWLLSQKLWKVCYFYFTCKPTSYPASVPTFFWQWGEIQILCQETAAAISWSLPSEEQPQGIVLSFWSSPSASYQWWGSWLLLPNSSIRKCSLLLNTMGHGCDQDGAWPLWVECGIFPFSGKGSRAVWSPESVLCSFGFLSERTSLGLNGKSSSQSNILCWFQSSIHRVT